MCNRCVVIISLGFQNFFFKTKTNAAGCISRSFSYLILSVGIYAMREG